MSQNSSQFKESTQQNILVTGGAGYIGSHVCKLLFSKGYTPVTFDNLVYGHKASVKWGPFIEGDLVNKDQITQALKTYKPIAVIHFAAYSYVGESVHKPAKYYRNNVLGSLNLLEAMQENDISNLIFSSTCATYGIPKEIPISDSHPQNPINPYGNTKLIMEQMMADFSKAYKLNYVSLRYFNAAGADPEGEIGEDHTPETHLIPLVLQTALGKREKIEIFGDDYPTEDGTCIRDYIHVCDLADAHLLALGYLEKGGDSRAFNLGNGNGFSVKQVIETAKKVTNKDIPYVISSRREGDPATLIGDAENIKQCLNWTPQFPSLEEIIETAWNWHKKK